MVLIPRVVLLEIRNLDITAINAFKKVEEVIAWRNKTHVFELIPQTTFPRLSDRTFCRGSAFVSRSQKRLAHKGHQPWRTSRVRKLLSSLENLWFKQFQRERPH